MALAISEKAITDSVCKSRVMYVCVCVCVCIHSWDQNSVCKSCAMYVCVSASAHGIKIPLFAVVKFSMLKNDVAENAYAGSMFTCMNNNNKFVCLFCSYLKAKAVENGHPI